MAPKVLPSEAARIIGVSPQRIRQLVDNGELAAERGPGGMRLIDLKAVERMAQERQRERATAGR